MAATRQRRWFRRATEDRALAPPDTPAFAPFYASTDAPLDVTTSNALRVADAYACVRVLADTIASLPLRAYRDTPTGRLSVGPDARIARLLDRPAPGSTGVDLISQVVVSLNVHGDAFIGKYRGPDGEIVQLGLLDPTQVIVELHGQRIVYRLGQDAGEYGPADILHVKAMSADGLRGLSPIKQCRLALNLSSNLQASAHQYFLNGSRPSGVLSVPSASEESIRAVQSSWNTSHRGTSNLHRVAVLSGDVNFTPLGFSADDSQFLGQRELSAREVARIFRVPAWAIDAPTGTSLTYANVSQQNRALVDYSLRPWLRRIERAISQDGDLCPGGTLVEFDLDELLRGDADTRSQVYARALDPATGWMTRGEVRDLENLPQDETGGPPSNV